MLANHAAAAALLFPSQLVPSLPNPPVFFCPYLNTESVTSIATGRLADSHNLDHLPPLQPQISRDGILLQDSWELRLLQSVSLKQGHLLLPAQKNVGWDQLVVGDVDEEILLKEALDQGVLAGHGHDLAGLGGESDGGDENAGLV